jgi:putative endopeptidase
VLAFKSVSSRVGANVVAAAFAVAALAGPSAAAEPRSARAPAASGIDRSALDPKVRAQDDLYRHVNGGWLATATFPGDKAYIGVGEQIYDTTQAHLRALIDEAPRRADDPAARRIADLYASFMDEAGIAARGLAPMKDELAAIDAVADRRQYAALLARLARRGAATPLTVDIVQDDRNATRYVPSVSQSGLGLPNRDYYLVIDDAKFAAARSGYQTYLAKLSALVGAPAIEADTSAKAVLALETEIARLQWSVVENRDPIKAYNAVAMAALPALASGFDWPVWLEASGLAGRTADVIVRQPSYLTGLAALLQNTPLATLKAYARVHLLAAYAPYLPREFVDARFAFVGPVLMGTPENRPRWKRGIALVNEAVGESLGKLYVERYFPPASKRRMDALVGNLLATYRDSITKLTWMSAPTRREALAKLAKFNTKIGYPSRWLDYSALTIRADDLVGNVIRARAFESARQLNKLGQPIDRAEWGMTPQTVNAYYDPSMNEIVFPAAYLQAPNFDPNADDAVNYGAIGMVIGHEISHGFDDQGAQYDGDGNLRDWWTPQDKANFAAKTKALVVQYNAFVAVAPDYRVNGELTLGENIADNSGLAIAYKAYRRSLRGKPAPVIAGMSGDQRFFFGYAQAWRSKVRDNALLAQIKSDPHSPDEFRVTGPARNMPSFYSTFGVKPGDKMYLAPKDRVSIW